MRGRGGKGAERETQERGRGISGISFFGEVAL